MSEKEKLIKGIEGLTEQQAGIIIEFLEAIARIETEKDKKSVQNV